MNFQFAGSVSNSVKTKALEMKWQERKQNLQAPKEDPMIANIKRQAEDIQKSNKISSIDTKLKTGQRLSSSEMSYLREHAPDLYEKAVKIEQEREQYKRELANCKTKEDVARLNANKMQQFLSEAKAIDSNPNIPKEKKLELLDFIAMRMMMTMHEYTEFIKSPEYQRLPSELDEEDDDDDRDAAPEIKERDHDLEDIFNKDEDPFPENPIDGQEAAPPLPGSEADQKAAGKDSGSKGAGQDSGAKIPGQGSGPKVTGQDSGPKMTGQSAKPTNTGHIYSPNGSFSSYSASVRAEPEISVTA